MSWVSCWGSWARGAPNGAKASMMEIVNVGLSGEFSWIVDILKDMSREWELQAWAVQNNIDLFELSKEGLANLTTAFNNSKDAVGGLSRSLSVTDSWLEKLDGSESVPKILLEGETPGAVDPDIHPLDAAQNLKNLLASMDKKTTTHKIKMFIEEQRSVTGMGGVSEFQHGGTFTVPSGFPRDGFRMGVSSGEQVNVSNRDERSFFSGSNVNINNGTDLDVFEELLRQIQ